MSFTWKSRTNFAFCTESRIDLAGAYNITNVYLPSHTFSSTIYFLLLRAAAGAFLLFVCCGAGVRNWLLLVLSRFYFCPFCIVGRIPIVCHSNVITIRNVTGALFEFIFQPFAYNQLPIRPVASLFSFFLCLCGWKSMWFTAIWQKGKKRNFCSILIWAPFYFYLCFVRPTPRHWSTNDFFLFIQCKLYY